MTVDEQCGPLAGSCTSVAIVYAVWLTLGIWLAWCVWQAWRRR